MTQEETHVSEQHDEAPAAGDAPAAYAAELDTSTELLPPTPPGGQPAAEYPPADRELGSRALRLGDEGPDVAHVQELLDTLDSAGEASGTYDEATEAAVKRYQRLRGLPQDGVVDEDTWALLLAPAQESG